MDEDEDEDEEEGCGREASFSCPLAILCSATTADARLARLELSPLLPRPLLAAAADAAAAAAAPFRTCPPICFTDCFRVRSPGAALADEEDDDDDAALVAAAAEEEEEDDAAAAAYVTALWLPPLPDERPPLDDEDDEADEEDDLLAVREVLVAVDGCELGIGSRSSSDAPSSF